MPAQAEAASSSTAPCAQSSTARPAETTPAAVLAFPRRNSNDALAWLASVDVRPSVRRTGRALAAHAAVHARGVKHRHIRPGELACWVEAATLVEELGGGKRKKTIWTVQRDIQELMAAGLERRRTAGCNTYVFPFPEVEKAPEIRGRIAENASPHASPDAGCVEPRVELRIEDPPPPRACATSPAPRRRCDCGHSWPASYGDECHECERAARAERRRRGRGRRGHHVPANVRRQAERRIAAREVEVVFEGDRAAERRIRIVTLEQAIQRFGRRVQPAVLGRWRQELAGLLAGDRAGAPAS